MFSQLPLNPIPLAGGAGLLLMSVLVYQGLRMNRTTPRFAAPDAPPFGVLPGDGPPVRLLVLGDSTVAGVGAPDLERALVGCIATDLSQSTRRAVAWRAVGQNGVTVAACRQRLIPRLEGEHADLVVVALGVNDVVLFSGARQWAADIRGLIDDVRGQIGHDVPMVFSAVPPMGNFPAFPQPLRSLAHFRSRLLDRALRSVVRSAPRVYYAPVSFKGGRAYFCADGYHPSPLGYQAWAQMLAPVTRDVLRRHVLADE